MTFPVVRSSFPAWTAQFEGRIPWPYLDAKGKVTAGIGWLLESPAEAIALPWEQPVGSRASAAVITDAFNRVAAAQQFKGVGGNQPVWRDLTGIRIPAAAFDAITLAKFDANDAQLRAFFPGFDGFPADAQRVIHSMTYAMGAGKFALFPKFVAAANALDFKTAAAESHISEEGNAPIHPRNLADEDGLLRAAFVVAQGLPRDVFYGGPLPASAAIPTRRATGVVALLLLVGGAVWFATRPS